MLYGVFKLFRLSRQYSIITESLVLQGRNERKISKFLYSDLFGEAL